MDSARPRVLAPGGAAADPEFPALEVALLAFICFLPALRAGFVYDDLLLIQDNRYAHALAYLGRAFTRSFWHLDDHGNNSLSYYRPLVTVTYIVNWVFAGGKPWFFHFFNVVVHAATTYLVALVARRWTGHDVLGLAVALIFALHPSRTESVVWVSGRTDVLMTFFVLLSVELSHRAALASTPRARNVRLGLSVGSLILALLSKETAAILPLLLLVDFLALGSSGEKRAIVPGLVAHVVVVVVYVAERVLAFPVSSIGTELTFTPRYGLLTVWQYVERTLWPWPQTFFYRPLRSNGTDFVYPPLLLALGAAVIVVYAALLVRMARKDRSAAWLLVVAAASLGPLLNFTYTGIFVTTSDHFLYLPLFLFLAGIARFHGDVLSRWARGKAVRVAFFGVLFLYGAVTTARTLDYKDQEAIFTHELGVDPDNPMALKSLSEVKAKTGRLDEAFELLLRATQPASRAYTILVPAWRNHQHYIRLLDLLAGETSDGNVHDLLPLYRELDALLRGAPPPFVGMIGELPVGERIPAIKRQRALADGTRELLVAETALLASRLGFDTRARELVRGIRDSDLDVVPNAQNLALTYARLGDFATARKLLDTLLVRWPLRYPADSLTPEKQRFDRAEQFFRQAEDPTASRERPLLRAEAFLELGAYLRALRELRPVFLENPLNGEVGSLYVQLLVAAGLTEEALSIAEKALGEDAAAALVRRISQALPARVVRLRRSLEPVDWYGLLVEAS